MGVSCSGSFPYSAIFMVRNECSSARVNIAVGKGLGNSILAF